MSNLNLLPDYYVKERFRYRMDMICVVLFAIVMAALIVVGKRTERNLDEIQAEYEKVTSSFSAAGEFVQSYMMKQGQRDRLGKDLLAYERMRQPVAVSYILGEITAACPEDVALNFVDIQHIEADSMPGRNLPGQKARSVTIPAHISVDINGVAEDVESILEFVNVVRSHPLVPDVVWPGGTERTLPDGTVVREFKISFKVSLDKASVAAAREAIRQAAEATPPPDAMDADNGSQGETPGGGA